MRIRFLSKFFVGLIFSFSFLIIAKIPDFVKDVHSNQDKSSSFNVEHNEEDVNGFLSDESACLSEINDDEAEHVVKEVQILNQKENDQKYKNDVILCCVLKQAQLQAQQTGIQLFTAITNLFILTGALFIWLELYTVNSQLLTMELQNNIKGSFYGH
ncbi:MAG: hypothetical protein WD055_06320 [Candidatus Dependentiae bacterium]